GAGHHFEVQKREPPALAAFGTLGDHFNGRLHADPPHVQAADAHGFHHRICSRTNSSRLPPENRSPTTFARFAAMISDSLSPIKKLFDGSIWCSSMACKISFDPGFLHSHCMT